VRLEAFWDAVGVAALRRRAALSGYFGKNSRDPLDNELESSWVLALQPRYGSGATVFIIF